MNCGEDNLRYSSFFNQKLFYHAMKYILYIVYCFVTLLHNANYVVFIVYLELLAGRLCDLCSLSNKLPFRVNKDS